MCEDHLADLHMSCHHKNSLILGNQMEKNHSRFEGSKRNVKSGRSSAINNEAEHASLKVIRQQPNLKSQQSHYELHWVGEQLGLFIKSQNEHPHSSRKVAAATNSTTWTLLIFATHFCVGMPRRISTQTYYSKKELKSHTSWVFSYFSARL